MMVDGLKNFLQKSKATLIFLFQWLSKTRLRKKDFDIGNNNKLYYWKLSYKEENLGDYLSKIVVTYFMPK